MLTLFERLPAAELPFYLDLMAHLARHGIPCPAPVADLGDRYLSSLNGKPAALVTRLEGEIARTVRAPPTAPSWARCSRACTSRRAPTAATSRIRAGRNGGAVAAREVRPFLDAAARSAARRGAALPVAASLSGPAARRGARGPVPRQRGLRGRPHQRRVRLLFRRRRLLCLRPRGLRQRLVPGRSASATGGWTSAARAPCSDAYAAVRPLQAAEREAWPVLLRAAALRFWLSRLHDKHLPRPGELVKVHDPEHFRRDPRLRAAPGALHPGSTRMRANRLDAIAGLRWIGEAFLIFRVAPLRQLALQSRVPARRHAGARASAGRFRAGLAADSGADGRPARGGAHGLARRDAGRGRCWCRVFAATSRRSCAWAASTSARMVVVLVGTVPADEGRFAQAMIGTRPAATRRPAERPSCSARC